MKVRLRSESCVFELVVLVLAPVRFGCSFACVGFGEDTSPKKPRSSPNGSLSEQVDGVCEREYPSESCTHKEALSIFELHQLLVGF